MIRLVGPGGADKTTEGLVLADRLGAPFVDLDEQFTAQIGDISAYLLAHGYQTYANRNIATYLETFASFTEPAVFALSSGFMTYEDCAHPDYSRVYQEIVASPSTAVLLPSFDCETCVAETVRRQLRRPFSRSVEREEQVVRERFAIYRSLPTKKFETMGLIEAVVDEIVTYLLTSIRLQPMAG
jgi:shikimate kinase